MKHCKIWSLGFLSLLTIQTAAGQEDLAIVFRLGDKDVQLETLPRAEALDQNSGALTIWSQNGSDRWLIGSPDATASLAAATRSFDIQMTRDSNPVAASADANPRSSLDQIVGQVVIRGEGFLTPAHGGRHLNGKLTLRRRPQQGEIAFPADSITIYQGNKPLLEVPLAEGVAKLSWAEIPDLPQQFADGLPPGTYSLRYADGKNNTSFTVEDEETAQWMLARSETLADLLGESSHPLVRVLTIGEMLSAIDEEGKPKPYLCDALDLTEQVSQEDWTQYLREWNDRILRQLKEEEPASTVEQPTGIDTIDEARSLILQNRWQEATALLQPLLQESEDRRAQGLANLYTATILSESAADTTAAASADEHFAKAIECLQEAPESDRFRAHNNYANFLLLRSQDRLYNYAFQAASGVSSPLLLSVGQWQQAREQYEQALQLAESLPPGQIAATQVNLARAYVLLADIVQTLCRDEAELSRVGHDRIVESARQSAAAASENDPDAMTRGAAAEILAHLAFRDEDADTCRRHLHDALKAYTAIGYLPGIESGYRTLGMMNLRFGSSAAEQNRADTPLNSLMISQLLTEILRERFDSGRSGATRSGFFARRAYVNEQIVELLIQQGDAMEALRFAELGKARSLQDVLMSKNLDASAANDDNGPELDELLEHWPDDVVGLEYFLGSENSWVFVIAAGEVQALPLVDGDGSPIASRQLIAEVTGFLQGMNFTAQQMLARYQSEGRFDSSWQDTLADYYSILIPPSIQNQLTAAKTVVIVPHHVLHYFPFAALVTEVDVHKADGFETVMPKFLIEQDLAITYAPSLESWALFRDRDRRVQKVHAIGIAEFEGAASLPGVEQDLKNLKEHFGDQMQTFVTGDQALESEVVKLLHQPGMLFAATHGMNHADAPMSSFLLCHADEVADGHLTASEVFANEVGADVVVMSACFSGLADRSPLPGDDLFGLQRAFLSSGANSVVSGQWDVYDATGPLLMNAFFAELNQGIPVASALAGAQRSFLRDRRIGGRNELWIHPYFWAVYTAAGSDLVRFDAKPKR